MSDPSDGIENSSEKMAANCGEPLDGTTPPKATKGTGTQQSP